MEIENTFIEGLKLIHLKKFKDTRGTFVKVFNEDFFNDNGMKDTCKESYYSISQKNVIRGMHFQLPPYEHSKLVYVNRGAILDVTLDLRINSKTFGCFLSTKITQESGILIYIPAGFAHGLLSLEDNTMITSLQSTVYNQKADRGIKYDSFGMNWGDENFIISEKDNSLVNFTDFKSPFTL